MCAPVGPDATLFVLGCEGTTSSAVWTPVVAGALVACPSLNGSKGAGSGKACVRCEKRAGKVGLADLRRCMVSIGVTSALLGCDGHVDGSTSNDSADSGDVAHSADSGEADHSADGSDPAQDEAGPVCQHGACDALTCGGTSVDPQTDNGNCGACGTTCSAAQVCVHGSCVTPASCQASAAGTTNCGSASESCCTSLEVPSGTFYRTYDTEVYGSAILSRRYAIRHRGSPRDAPRVRKALLLRGREASTTYLAGEKGVARRGG